MCNKVLFVSLAAVLSVVMAFQPAIAQQPDPESPTKLAEKFLPQGTSNVEAEPVTSGMFYDGHSTFSFQPYSYDNVVDISGCVFRTASSTFGYLASRVQLPQGARVQELTLYSRTTRHRPRIASESIWKGYPTVTTAHFLSLPQRAATACRRQPLSVASL